MYHAMIASMTGCGGGQMLLLLAASLTRGLGVLDTYFEHTGFGLDFTNFGQQLGVTVGNWGGARCSCRHQRGWRGGDVREGTGSPAHMRLDLFRLSPPFGPCQSYCYPTHVRRCHKAASCKGNNGQHAALWCSTWGGCREVDVRCTSQRTDRPS
jgi:hypothetical protein